MTTSRHRLALAIPAHDAAPHLGRLMDSVHAQSEPFDEVLLYDDASTDATKSVAEAMGATVISGGANVGASIGKNRLAGSASSEWIHFHDADDALAPEFVARAKRWIREDSADVVLFATSDRDDLTGAPMWERWWDETALAADPVRYCIVHTVTNCGIYRRQAFLDAGGFDARPEIRYNEDQAMHLRLALRGLRFRCEPYAGVIIYRRSGSMSSGHPIECARAHYKVLEDTAHATGTRYAAELGNELWHLAGVCGSYLDWDYVRRCTSLALELGWRDPVEESGDFRLLARVSPMLAVRVREATVRLFKRELREGVPTVG
jgi:glycosyltransferase involved in cell wall biosynthesis